MLVDDDGGGDKARLAGTTYSFNSSGTVPPRASTSYTNLCRSLIFSTKNCVVTLSTWPSDRPCPSRPGTMAASRSKPSRIAVRRFCSVVQRQGEGSRQHWADHRWGGGVRHARTGRYVVLAFLLLGETRLFLVAIGRASATSSSRGFLRRGPRGHACGEMRMTEN